MVRPGKMTNLIADVVGIAPASVDQHYRSLRATGALPESRRGAGAADLTADHAAIILISLAVSASPSEGAARA